jgi:pre-rRNA-processing protein TSR4
MSLLLQLNGAIDQSPHERMFYLFACKEKTCRRKKGTVRAIRGVRVAKDFEEREAKAREEAERKRAEAEARRKAEENKPKPGDLLFGSGGLGSGGAGANPFSTGGGGGNPFSTGANPFSKPAATTAAAASTTATETLTKSFADTLKISLPAAPEPEPEPLLYGPSEPWPESLPHQYPQFYFDAEYETLVPDKPAPQKTEMLLDDNGGDSLPVSNSDADDGHLDVAFQKFADRVGQNPEQVLRYERGGTPLLYSHDDEVAKILLNSRKEYSTRQIPPCGGCGKRERVFEFQLMPHAITVLEGDELSLDGMEWGTILVATCTCTPKVRDANGVGWVEEWVGVQWEAQK